MSPLTSSQESIRFGDFDVDLHGGELRKHGIRIKLQVQPFQILRILLEHPGQAVTREELQKRIWPADTFVDFDHGLNNAVKKLREALGDDAEKPRFIETLSKRGYRFIGSVQNGAAAAAREEVPATSTTSTETTTSKGPRKRFAWGLWGGMAVIAALVLVLGLNTGGTRDRLLGKSATPRIQSLAVLPLQNLSSDPAQEYFSDGMTDALITELAQIGSLKVISRTSSMQYKQTKKSLPAIARELNVEGIVEGTVQRSGDRVRITAQLIHGPSDKHLWANSYERDIRDVFALEREVTADIADRVQAQLTTGREARPVQPRPLDLKVLDAYLQGNYHLNKADAGGRDQELRKASEFFRQAIDAEPNFAPAYVGLAKAHYNLWWPSEDDLSVMSQAAEHAVALDASSSDAWIERGDAKTADWDWAGAQQQYRRAIALNPNSASAHQSLAEILDSFGELEEGWREHNIAQQLDPNEDHLSEALRRRGQYDRAIDLLKKVSERRPEDGVISWLLSENYVRKGLYADWVEELGRCVSLFGFPKISDHLHRAFTASGYSGALRAWTSEMELWAAKKQAYFPGILAEEYAALGDRDRAFYWLGQGCDHPRLAVADPILQFLKVDPGFVPLRSDPRFGAILHCMGLPP